MYKVIKRADVQWRSLEKWYGKSRNLLHFNILLELILLARLSAVYTLDAHWCRESP